MSWLSEGDPPMPVEPPPIAGVPGWLLALDAPTQAALLRLIHAAELMSRCREPVRCVPLSWLACQAGVREALRGVRELQEELERGTGG